jgi:AAHS family 4-hydroxybenzoate transporter-like MFS transporter
VLSAALFGLAAGALAAGPLADRLGRKAMLAASMLLMGPPASSPASPAA